MKPVLAVGVGLMAAMSGAAALGARTQPEAKAGPYRVVIDRVTENRSFALTYRAPSGREDERGVQARRSLQIQVSLLAEDARAVSGLSTFRVSGVTVEGDRRSVTLPYSGGALDSSAEAAVRAYLYVPSVPPLEGEIVSYDNTGAVEIELPVAPGTLPRTVEKDGVKATLREVTTSTGSVRMVLTLEAPSASTLLNLTSDGTYGISLYSHENRRINPSSATMSQPRANVLEYRFGFQSLRGTVDRVRVRALHRGGPRRVYAFRVERIPIPSRSDAAPPGTLPGTSASVEHVGQNQH
jgi:hypothetical protein